MDKYYSPQEEEFSIGLECQVYYPREEGWKDRKIRHLEDLCEIVSRYTTDKESVRIKYLDEDDVLDLGFEKGSGNRYFTRNEYQIELLSDSIEVLSEYGFNTLFEGKIKNKSELKNF